MINVGKKMRAISALFVELVGVAGFEPATPSSRTRWLPVNLKVHRDSHHSLRCPFFVLAVGARMGALMPMSMFRPPLVFAGVGDALFSLLRATREFMFAGSERLRFRRRRLL